MTINFRQRWRTWGDRDHWKIVLDPYRDWRRLLFFTALGIMVVIGVGLYMLLVVEKTHERANSTTASSSAPTSLLLDSTAINRAAWFIEAVEILPVPPEGVEPSSTP